MPIDRTPSARSCSTGADRRLGLLAAAAAVALMATPAAAQTKPDAEVEGLIVTGVRGVPRTVMDSPTPIDSFSAAELEKSGRAGVFSALQTLAPSFNLPTRSGGGTATVIATGGLRGLNPDQTLILVNGKRRHKTSLINTGAGLFNGSVPSDLDQIPVSAIARIEVLRDGAAAQYGSDAIAGVINIITKTNSDGGLVSATYGLNFDRKDGDLTQYAFNKGFTFGDAGYVNLSVNYKDQRLSNRAYPIDPSVQLFPLVNGARDPREATIDRLVTKNFGQLPQTNTSVALGAGYDFGGVSAYGFGTWGKRESDLPFTFRNPNNVNTTPQLYPFGFRPNEVINEDDYEVTGGLKGEITGWSWDVSTGYGSNKAALHTSNTENASLGPASPTTFYVGTLKSDEWTSNLDITKSFELTNLGKLQVSFGGQHRREGYQVIAGDPASYAEGLYVAPAGQPFAGVRPQTGAQATPGFRPSDESDTHRSSNAVYGELGWDVSDAFFVGAAARYENYSDSSGDTLTGKLTARYELAEWIAVRAAVSTGFRAPGLAQQHYAATTSQFRTVLGVNNVLLLIKTLPVDSPDAIKLGAVPLTPEKSENFSGGVTLKPLPGLDITVDGYQIDVDKRISIISTLTGTLVDTILGRTAQNSLSAQYYTNAIDTRTRGVDIVATYRYDIGDWGSLRLNAAYGKNTTKITGIIPTPAAVAAVPSYQLFGRGAQGSITTSYPHTKIALGANWDWNKLNVNIRSTRFGKFTTIADLPVNDRSYGAKWITDLEVSYKIRTDTLIAAGANNLFNEYPDKNGVYNPATGTGFFPGSSPYGFTGGSWYARVQYSF